MKDKLLKRFPENNADIEKVLEEFTTSNFLSDERFTAEFVRVKSEYSGWGPRKISQKLKEKGVSSEIISKSIETSLPSETRLEIAQRLAQEKWKLLYKKKGAERTAAVQRFLVSRGFDFDLIFSVTKNLSSSSLDLPEDQ